MTTPRSADPSPSPRPVRGGDVGRLLVRGAPFALAVTLLAVAVAVLVTRTSDPVYRASVTLVAPRNLAAPTGVDVVAPAAIDPGVYRSAVFEGGVLADAADALAGRPLGETELERIERSVRVSVEDQDLSSTLRIEARATTPAGAADLANAIASGLVAWDRDRARQVLEGSVTALETALAEVDAQLADPELPAAQRGTLEDLQVQRSEALEAARARAAAAVPVGLIAPLRAAEPPERAVGPRLVLNVAIALALGLALGYALVLLRWTLDPRVADARELEAVAQRPVLATFPRRVGGAPRLSDEASGLLKVRVTALRPPAGCLIVVIATPRNAMDQEGVAVGLAESCARSGISTLLVDADLRSARSSAWLDVNVTRATPYDDGFLDEKDARFEPVSVLVEGQRAFDFIPAFAPARHPMDRIDHVLSAYLDEWTERYELIVLDAAPVLDHADALVTALRANGVVLCAAAGRGARADVIDAVDVFQEQGIPVIGTVLTNLRRRAASQAAGVARTKTAAGVPLPALTPTRARRGATPSTPSRGR